MRKSRKSNSDTSCFAEYFFYRPIAFFGTLNVPVISHIFQTRVETAKNLGKKNTRQSEMNSTLSNFLDSIEAAGNNICALSYDERNTTPLQPLLLVVNNRESVTANNHFNASIQKIDKRLQKTYFFHWSQLVVFFLGAIGTAIYLANAKSSFLPLQNRELNALYFGSLYIMGASLYISFLRCLTGLKKQVPSALGALAVGAYYVNQVYPYVSYGKPILDPILYTSAALTLLPFIISFSQYVANACRKKQKGPKELDELSAPLQKLYLIQLKAAVIAVKHLYADAIARQTELVSSSA